MTGSDTRLRVLLVDDDEDDYVLTRDLLEEIPGQGFRIEWASSWNAARDAIARAAHDVYLVDYRLGERDGLELLREAKALGCTAPIILLTGQGDHAVDVEAMRSGAADYLVKGQIGAGLLERAIRHAIERTQALAALRESERFLQSALDALTSRIAIVEASGAIAAVNEAWRRAPAGCLLAGVEPGQDLLEACAAVPGERAGDARAIAAGIRDVLRLARDEICHEYSCEAPGGDRRWFVARLTRFGSGIPPRAVVALEDVSVLKRAEEALRQREEQLRQAHKMEAVGRLAGGVAHDFNNILAAITAYSDLGIGQVRPGDPLRPFLEGISRAADRGASFTRQLLTFSRKQLLEPRAVDLDELVDELQGMLRRLLREDIELVVQPGADGTRVRADPGQLEQVVMNLAVNARDAMPGGGRLEIATRIAELTAERAAGLGIETPGQYVVLSVSDTGTGMDEATRLRIFEPFFTTKSRGQGTGLGLATVYGVAQQAGGTVRVQSAPGRGATFEVYLPRTEAPADPGVEPHAAASPHRGDETVLLVEDDDVLRPLVRDVLVRHGYRVLEAPDGREALAVAAAEDRIDALVTDVVMPQLGGCDLALELLQRMPDLCVVLMSGYTEDSTISDAVLDAGGVFLAKPFRLEVLLRTLRELLDTAPRRTMGVA